MWRVLTEAAFSSLQGLRQDVAAVTFSPTIRRHFYRYRCCNFPVIEPHDSTPIFRLIAYPRRLSTIMRFFLISLIRSAYPAHRNYPSYEIWGSTTEDGSSRLLRNVCSFIQCYTAYNSRR